MAWQWMAAALALAAAQAPASDMADGHVFTVTTYVQSWDSDSGDWVELSDLDQRVSIPAGPERETYWRLLVAAIDRGVALRIRFDAAAGRLNAAGDRIVYPLCSIGAANGSRFGDEARNCPAGAQAAPEAERLLALGVAQVPDQPDVARRTLTRALAVTRGLPPRARALALKARGEAGEVLAYQIDVASPALDRLWADALADFRERLTLTPDDAVAHFDVARMLISLGGYGEALDIYRAIGRRWPEEAYNVAVRTGALYRQQGNYAQALRELDDYARRDPAAARGMKIHYHRAWTLTLLGRDEEAIGEIERGLASQPDYSSAYLLRSCARARLGRLEEALADQRRAAELRSELTTTPSAATRADLERSRTVTATLQQAIDARQRRPVSAPCDGFWDKWVHPRERSPLLDADGRAPS